MTATTETPLAGRAKAIHATDHSPPDASRGRTPFLIGPVFDLIFVANLLWPLLFLVDWWGPLETHSRLLFWQIYFITTPHRWMTLLLVLGDSEKTAGRRGRFILFGGALAIGCLVVRFGTGSLLCLGAIDYLWNAWHFAAQHHGISRIYERRESPPAGRFSVVTERWLLRGFLLFVIARVAGLGWTIDAGTWTQLLAKADLVALVIPLYLTVMLLVRRRQIAGIAYLLSVLSLFASLLLAAHFQNSALVLKLSLASAVFHAVEYMAIVSWSVGTEVNQSRTDAWGRMSRMWFSTLLVFVVVIGASNYLLSTRFRDTWLLLNIILAFWHYCFDGMIWKPVRKNNSLNRSAGTAL